MRSKLKSDVSALLSKQQKEKFYKKAIEDIKVKLSTLEGGIIVPRMATVAAVLHDIMPHFYWCGFYFAEEKELVIGPYQGTTACPNIAYTGVCGVAAKKKQALIVPDVHKFPGHIVCDEKSNSEIVIPLLDDKKRLIAVFDVDSTTHGAFDDVDQKYLEKILPILLEGEVS